MTDSEPAAGPSTVEFGGPRATGVAPTVVREPVQALVARARVLAAAGGRRILGLTGPPGAGKSTVARTLVDALGPDTAVLVPMDGFHLANVTLRALGRRDRKGAWDTFDVGGYVALLRRLRAADEPVVHAPDFDRQLEEPIGSAVPVAADVPLVVTEGNYLLSREGGWGGVAFAARRVLVRRRGRQRPSAAADRPSARLRRRPGQRHSVGVGQRPGQR